MAVEKTRTPNISLAHLGGKSWAVGQGQEKIVRWKKKEPFQGRCVQVWVVKVGAGPFWGGGCNELNKCRGGSFVA